MILTVTINPLLEYRLTFENVMDGVPNRNGKIKLAAGGKGINVNRQLNKLKIKNIALTFAGGVHGKLFRESLNNEGTDFSLINTSSDTRMCAVIIDQEKRSVSYYFGEDQSITNEECDRFIRQLEKMIQNCEIVIFSGSSPCKETDSIFPIGIEMANRYDKISICDTYGKHLENCYSASPRVVHNNVDEVSDSLHINLENEVEKIEFLNSLYDKGIKQVFLTNGAQNTYASNFDFHFRVEVPDINCVDSTGSGDAFVAGIAYGWHNNLIFNGQLKFASAIGVENAKAFDVCNVEAEDANKIAEYVKVIPIGKKMKIIDDTPK
jgi:tagatose 6-phosphate kinase